MRNAGRLKLAAYALILLGVNVAIIWRLFSLEYSLFLESVEGSFIAIARVMAEHQSDLLWWPLWNSGIPFQNTYLPLLSAVTAIFSRLTSCSPALAYHAVSATFYTLGAIALFVMAWRMSGKPGLAFLSALTYSLFSPSVLLDPLIRADAGGWWNLRRLRALVYYGEGPHTAALALLPFALLAFYLAFTSRGRLWPLASGFLAAAIVLTNAFGAVTLAMGLVCMLCTLNGQSFVRNVALTFAISVVAYCAISPFVPPSLLQTIRMNSPTSGGNYAFTMRSFIGCCIVAAVVVITWWIVRRVKLEPFARFLIVFAVLISAIVLLGVEAGMYVLPQPHRYHLGMDLVVCAAIVFLLEAALRRTSQTIRRAVLGVFLVLALGQFLNTIRYSKEVILPVDITTTAPYRIAVWMDRNLNGELVMAGGSSSFWLNLFSNNPQLQGGHEPFHPNFSQRIALFTIYSGMNAGSRDAEISTAWLKAFGAHAISVQGAHVRDYFRPFANPEKFEGFLPVLARDPDYTIYGVPSRSKSLAHVIPREAVVKRAPVHGLDIDPLAAYLKALDNPAYPIAHFEWKNRHSAQIRTSLAGREQVVLVQMNYTPGWRASVNGRPLSITADGIGLMIIQPDCTGECEIALEYDGGAERKITWILSCIAMIIAAVWACGASFSRWSRFSPGSLVLLMLLPLATAAQTTTATATIQGSAIDPSGASVPDARVMIRNAATRAERTTRTDAGGHFAVANLPPGTYTLTVEASGFSPVNVAAFLLSIGQVLTQRVDMQPAGITERIEVNEAPEAIDAAASTASVALGYERIEEAPARSRNYLNFVLAAPAVAPSAGTSSQRTMTGIRTTLGDSGFTFGGMRARNNAILIDGMDNRDETTGGNRVAVGLEMVQEFRVAGNAMGAELGGAAGGLLNMVTRSGVNLWHGDMTFFAQNERFNARRSEIDSVDTPRFRRYQPGVSLLGPIKRDRTFFAAAVEHERESEQDWSNIPEAAAVVINQALATPLFSNDTSRVLRGFFPTSTVGTDLSLKLNHQASSRDTLAARYAFSRGSVRDDVQGPDNFGDRSSQGSSLTRDHSFVANWLRVVSPALVNDVRIQSGERNMELRPNATGPMLEIPGVATLGQFYRMNADRAERHNQVVENVNLAIRRHRLSAGVDAHFITLDAALSNRYTGIFIFPTLDDFVQGRPDIFVQAFGNPHTSLATLPVGVWLQDRWQARPDLLVELGVRYDRQRMPDGISPSSNNWSPRVGLAWRPSQVNPFVFRAGFGLFYDRYPLAYLNEALQKDGIHGFEQYAVGQNALRAFQSGHGGRLTAPLDGIAPSLYHTAARFDSTYSRKATVGMELGIAKDTSLSIEANHIRGFRLPRSRNILGALPPLYELEQTARSDYIGASFSLNRRMSRDLAYLVAYNVGRTRDDGSDFDEQPMDPLDIRRDWALSRQHQQHRLSASALFNLPVDGLTERLKTPLDDISIAPILTVGTGRPINALLTTDAYRTGAYPISARPLDQPRNPYRSPANVSLDLRVMKTIYVMERRAVLQFGAESFNLLNHTNTERVSQYFAAGGARLASYGQIIESLPARQLQFLIQFEY